MRLRPAWITAMLSLLLSTVVPAPAPGAQAAQPRILTLSYETKFGGLKTVNARAVKRRPVVGLALSGGGARAASSLGVLKALRDQGITVDIIAGTSMGAIVGGLAAAGCTPEEIGRIFAENDWNDLFSDTPPRAFLTQDRKESGSRHLLQFSFIGGRFSAPGGLTAGQKLADLLMAKTLSASIQAGMDFDRLPIRFRAVATDLESGSAVAIGNGMLHDALRASSAIPALFPPVEIKGRLFADGGLTDNLPVSAAQALGADIVIAVDASTPLDRKEGLSSLVDVLSQSISIPVRRETEKQAALADLVISPDTAGFSFADFDRMAEIARRGELAAQAAMQRIRELVSEREKRIRKEERFALASLTVRGVGRAPADALLAAFPRPISRAWTEDELMSSLAAAYETGQFADLSLALIPRNGAFDAVLSAAENPVVDAISISGTSLISPGEIMDELEGQLGAPLNAPKVIEALERVMKRWRDRGYLLARLEHAGMRNDGKTLDLVVREGRLDAIRLAGHRRTAMSLVRREMETTPGKPVNFITLAEDTRRLYGLNYYETLQADIRENRDGGVDLTLKVKEKPRGNVRLGLRYDLDDAFTGLTDIVVDNLLGKGVQFAVQTRYGNYTDLTAGYRSPVLLSTSFVHRLEGFYRNRTYSLYHDQQRSGELEVTRAGFDFAFGYQWFRFGDTYLRYRFSSDRQIGIYGIPAPENPRQLGSLAFLTTIDTRDSGLFPRSGFLLSGSYETASPSYGGDLDFRKTTVAGQFAVPLSERFTATASFFSGFGSGSPPYQEQYGLGGIDALISAPLPGYERREFVGANMATASLGCRWRIADYQLKAVKALYLNATAGAGNVWDSRDAVSTRTLLTGGSLGLHANTIVGPLRLDFGTGEDRRYQVYFSVGYEY